VSKGLLENVTYSILVVLMIGVLSVISVEQVIGVGELIRKETVQMAGDRIEASVQSIDSVDEAKLELEMGGKEGYRIYSEDGEKYVSYEYLSDSKRALLEEPQGIDYSINRDRDDGRVQYICIEKNSGITIKGGEC